MTAKMPIVMTLMVRDEADIIAAMVEHHIAQGVDLIIATDNASSDGTREILAQYAEIGVVELHDDPRVEKQQAEVVTSMARRAFTEHGAAWVINADADEFWFARSGGTIAEALAAVPEDVQSYNVSVRNLVGEPIESGSVIPTHTWRDERDDEALRTVGLHAQPTHDCVHRGSAHVTIQQGNHGTSLPLAEAVPTEATLEVLHLPYRQWSRYQERVRNTAAAYDRSGLTPSPRHHGMRDARWLREGVLRPMFVARHVVDDATVGFAYDDRVVRALSKLLEERSALIPELVSEALQPGSPLPGVSDDLSLFKKLGPWLVRESEARAELAYSRNDFYSLLMQHEALQAEQKELAAEFEATSNAMTDAHAAETHALREKLGAANATVQSLTEYVERLLQDRLVRAAARVTTPRYGWQERLTRAKRLLAASTVKIKSLADKPAHQLRQMARHLDSDNNNSTAERVAELWQSTELENLSRSRARAVAFARFQELWQNPPKAEVLHGEPKNESLPIIMCLWNRPGQIDAILEQLDRQINLPTPLRLVFWNNNDADHQWYRERIQAFEGTGALESVELIHSPHNIRGIGRFIIARQLWNDGARGNFIMLDDDEVLPNDALSRLLANGGKHRISSIWAWRVNPDDYWQRERAVNGEVADYTATGGCVCDLEIIADDSFFTELPELGLFIEDAWMSRYAAARGWSLTGITLPVEFVLHETNQYGPLIWDKVAFWTSLNDRYPLPLAEERRKIRN